MKEKIKFILLAGIAIYFVYRVYQIYFYTPDIDFKKLELKTTDNQDFRFQDNDLNKAIVVFFQTWCAPCIAEMKLVQKHHSKFNFTKIYFISDEEPEKILSLKNRLSLDSLNILHSEQSFGDIGIQAFPTTYIVRKKHIEEKHKGTFIDESNIEDEIFHLKELLK